jgi:phosphoribosylanthranilate isomerase
MPRTRVKICGITDEPSAKAAIYAGADALGFVFAKSPRQVTRNKIKGVVRGLPAFVTPVAVFKDDATMIGECIDRLPIRHVQIDIEAFVESDLYESDITVIPVVRTGTDFMLDLLDPEPTEHTFEPCVVEGPRSGVGEKCDWSEVAKVASHYQIILAGGLTPDNVAEAIRTVRPYGVDVSSGVESSPGKKDPIKIRDFLQAVRDVDRELQ